MLPHSLFRYFTYLLPFEQSKWNLWILSQSNCGTISELAFYLACYIFAGGANLTSRQSIIGRLFSSEFKTYRRVGHVSCPTDDDWLSAEETEEAVDLPLRTCHDPVDPFDRDPSAPGCGSF